MRVVICGNKAFSDWEKFVDRMDYLDRRLGITVVIQGGHVTTDPAENARPWSDRRKWGAEHFARRWAEMRRLQVIEEPILDDELKRLSAAAAGLRNKRMIDRHKPEKVIDFLGGDETRELLNQARAAGIKCIEVC